MAYPLTEYLQARLGSLTENTESAAALCLASSQVRNKAFQEKFGGKARIRWEHFSLSLRNSAFAQDVFVPIDNVPGRIVDFPCDALVYADEDLDGGFFLLMLPPGQAQQYAYGLAEILLEALLRFGDHAQSRLAVLLDAMPCATALIDDTLIYRYLNNAMLRTVGLKPEQLLSRRKESIAELKSTLLGRTGEELIREEKLSHTDMVFHRQLPDRGAIEHRMRTTLLSGEDGEPLGYSVVLLPPLTSHSPEDLLAKRAEEMRRRLGDIIEDSPVITVSISAQEGYPVLAISGNVRDLGFEPEQFYSGEVTFLDLISPKDRAGVSRALRRNLISCDRFSHSYSLQGRDGTAIGVRADMTVFRDSEGRALYFEGALTDSTAQDELEQALRQESVASSLLFETDASLRPEAMLYLETLILRQNQFCDLFGVTLMFWDTAGDPLSKPHNPHPAYRRLLPKEREASARALRDQLTRLGGEAGEADCPVTGLHYALIPVMWEGRTVAYCELGQVTLDETNEEAFQRGRFISRREFARIQEIWALLLASVSSYSANSFELLTQIQTLQRIQAEADSAAEGVNRLAETFKNLFEGLNPVNIVSTQFAELGSVFGFSRVYLAADSGACLYEWRDGSIRKTALSPRSLRLLSVARPEEGQEFLMVTDSPASMPEGGLLLDEAGALGILVYPLKTGDGRHYAVCLDICAEEKAFPNLTDLARHISAVECSVRRVFTPDDGNGDILQTLIGTLDVPLCVCDADTGEYLFASALFDGLFRTRPDPVMLTEPEYEDAGRFFRVTCADVLWPVEKHGRIYCLEDVTLFSQNERSIQIHRDFDEFLDVYNRGRMNRDLAGILDEVEGSSREGAVLVFHLDDFSYVTEAFGLAERDAELARFTSILREESVLQGRLYRRGENEFLAIWENAARVEVESLARRVRSRMDAQGTSENGRMNCTVSVGIARFPHDGHTVRELLSSADIALRRAQEAGRGTAMFFSEWKDIPAKTRRRLESALHWEVASGLPNMYLLYQPLCDAETGRWMGAEALLRWRDPMLGVMAAGAFLQLADQLGFAEQICHFVMERAVEDVMLFQTVAQDFFVSVNLFERQLQNDRLALEIQAVLDQYGCTARSLMLELSGQTFRSGGSAASVQLAAMRETGVRVCMEDLGAEGSALAGMRDSAWDMVKLAGSVARNFEHDPFARAMAESVADLGTSTELLLCAAGVETAEQAERLHAFGYLYMQGHHFSEPIPREDLMEILQKETTTSHRPANSSGEANGKPAG